jgi:hypothetical protein
VLGGLLEELADLEAALAVALPGERRTERGAGAAFGRDVVARQFLAVVFVERDLAVERVDLGGAAVGEDMDDALGLAGQRGLARGERAERVDADVGAAQFLLEQGGHGDAAEAHADAAEEFATGAEEGVEMEHRRRS